MQECDLYGRLVSRRLDKIVYIIQTRTLARFQFRYLAKEAGRRPNAAAILLVNQAILKAYDRDQSNPGAVTSLSASEFTVASATREHEEYLVRLVSGQDGQCTCQYRALNHVCWHIALCLRKQGITEGSILKCLGAYWGTQLGGYAKLYAAEDTSTLEDPSHAQLIEQPGSHEEILSSQQSEADAPADPEPSARKPPADTILCPSKLKAQWDEFYSVAISNDSAEAHFHMRAALEGLRSSIANRGIITALSSGRTLDPKPGAAKAHLGRHTDWLENYQDQARKKARRNSQSTQLPSDEELAQAEMRLLKSKPPPKKRKERTVLAGLQAAAAKASRSVNTSCRSTPATLQPVPLQQPTSMPGTQVPGTAFYGGLAMEASLQPRSQLAPQPGMFPSHYPGTFPPVNPPSATSQQSSHHHVASHPSLPALVSPHPLGSRKAVPMPMPPFSQPSAPTHVFPPQNVIYTSSTLVPTPLMPGSQLSCPPVPGPSASASTMPLLPTLSAAQLALLQSMARNASLRR